MQVADQGTRAAGWNCFTLSTCGSKGKRRFLAGANPPVRQSANPPTRPLAAAFQGPGLKIPRRSTQRFRASCPSRWPVRFSLARLCVLECGRLTHPTHDVMFVHSLRRSSSLPQRFNILPQLVLLLAFRLGQLSQGVLAAALTFGFLASFNFLRQASALSFWPVASYRRTRRWSASVRRSCR